jgi:hypothetical protein
MKSDRSPSGGDAVAAVRANFEQEMEEAGSRLPPPRRVAPAARALPKRAASLAALAIVVVLAASAIRVAILAPGASASPVASPAAHSPAQGPSASGPLAQDLPGYPRFSGSSGWAGMIRGLMWSNDTGRSWAEVGYPAGVDSDQVIALASAQGRPLWLAVRSDDGFRLYRKADVATPWSSVLVTVSAAVLRSRGQALFPRITPGPGRMLVVSELILDGHSVLFVSDDDGQSFVQLGSPAVSQIDMAWAWWAFTTPDSGVAVEMSAGHPDSAHPFLHTTDGGSSWVPANVVGLPPAGSYKIGTPRLIGSDVEVPIRSCGSTCATNPNQFFSLLVSHDGGATFNPLGVPTAYDVSLTPSWGNGSWGAPPFDTRGSSTWVSTGGGIIEETTDGGQTWTSVKPAGLPADFTSFDQLVLTGASSATAVVIYSGPNNAPPGGAYLVETTDGGRTWTRV